MTVIPPLTGIGLTALFGLWAAGLYLLLGSVVTFVALSLLNEGGTIDHAGKKAIRELPQNLVCFNAIAVTNARLYDGTGVWGSSEASLRKGQVHMRAQLALGDKEIEGGDILICQSVAETDTLALEFP